MTRKFQPRQLAALAVLAAAALAALLSACPAGRPGRTLAILQTSDLHCEPGHPGSPRGFLKLAPLLDKLAAESGGPANVLRVDCGDAFQGTALGSHNQGAAAAAFLNHARYDVFVPGNHDFDFGTAALAARLKELKPDILAANLELDGPAGALVKPWKLYERGGARVAVIGLTSPFLGFWLWGDAQRGYRTCSFEAALDKVMPEVLAARPDLVVVAAHQGLYLSKRLPPGNDLWELAKKWPRINLILGGHSHQEFPGKRVAFDAWYVQPGSRAEFLAAVKVELDAGGVKSISSRLVGPGRDGAVDGKLAALLKPALAAVDAQEREVVGKLERELKGEGPVGDFLGAAMAKAAGTTGAMVGVAPTAALPAGPVSRSALRRLQPFEDTVVVLSLSGAELAAVVEEQRLRGKGDVGAPPLRLWGVRADPAATGRLDIAFSSYAVAGAGNRYPALKAAAARPSSRARDTGVKIRDALAAQLRAQIP